ncbi:argininosuccinate lyase [Candidatus Woesearchaeota archaeon]|nr:argininosuccinate lyase [Candidatus Woesearchaeota archaeon]
MTKLWDKGYEPNKEIEKFTVGNDYILDKGLVKWDCLGSVAHASMLKKIGIINEKEFNKLKSTLKEIIKNKNFEIKIEDEDVHTAVEGYLTKKLGSLGKKIHTCRSRNDQVLVDTRLYTKDKLLTVKNNTLGLINALVKFAEKNKEIPMPGYTHTQKAMPSSAGLWAGAHAEALLDDLKLLNTAYEINNQCPLGSAAGYGVPFPIDRQYTSDLLGFGKVQNNVIYAQNSRGKIGSIVLSALTQIMLDIGKLANDLIIFSTVEFGYFKLPKEFCSGSSIMPQKVNPCVLELTRGKVSVMESHLFQMQNIIKNLYSGYNRDLQLTKEPLMKGLELAEDTTKIIELVINGVKVNKENCIKGCTPEVFATDYALEVVLGGTPFRDAYKKVAANIDKLKAMDPVKTIKGRKHIGSTGNLGLDKIKNKLNSEKKALDKENSSFESKLKKLVQ